MKISFSKYQATGNDFVILDCIAGQVGLELSADKIKLLCDRRFGIGADGLILVSRSTEMSFEMTYYNSDGREGSMCGNGGRCFIKFLIDHGYAQSNTAIEFISADGLHTGICISESDEVEISMRDVSEIKALGPDIYELDTGSPHYIKFVDKSDFKDITSFGRSVRFSPPYASAGINVNKVCIVEPDKLKILTYERGVEAETLSCGTGAVAAAIAHAERQRLMTSISVEALGGRLKVNFKKEANGAYRNISLQGHAIKVFDGLIEL